MPNKLEALIKQTEGISILYVEDNKKLLNNVIELLERFFHDGIYFAQDGVEGLKQFRKHSPQIVLSDINMPKMSGMEMVKKIKNIDPFVKCVFFTAHDEIDLLHEAIKVGAFDYIKKPVKANDVIEVLTRTIKVVRQEEFIQLLMSQQADILNYQQNIVIMFQNNSPVLVNKQFLDFFEIESLEEYTEKYHGIQHIFKPHDTFLYSNERQDWMDIIQDHAAKLFHAKIIDPTKKPRHFIAKCTIIPNKKNLFVATLTDVTDLNLMRLYDKKKNYIDDKEYANNSIIKLLTLVKENATSMKVYNYYKGVPIVKEAVLTNIEKDSCTIKTDYTTLKIVKLNENFVLSSETFPTSIICRKINKIDFDEQSITFSHFAFETTDIKNRQYMRVSPSHKDKVTISFKGTKFSGTQKIIDISTQSVLVEIELLSFPISINDQVQLTFALYIGNMVSSLTFSATVFSINEDKRKRDIVFMYSPHELDESKLLDYVAKRQLVLIKEFKETMI